MIYLILGLVIFLGVHSVRIVADDWRSARVARLGEGPWKGLYALASLAGFALIVWGYGQARVDSVVLWSPPGWTRQLLPPLTLLAFVLVVAAYVPDTHLKAWLGSPMVLGVKLWAFAHLIANGTLAGTVLFGSFLVWAVVDFASSRRRDRAAQVKYPAGSLARDALAVVVGIAAWAAFAFWLHEWLIGVRPFG
ncbi:MAG: NnrU family protein [Pseudomonadota bacterium]|nr:NnrU family protein [Pseudomonadota bacterium]